MNKHQARMELRHANSKLNHDYYAVNSVDGRKLRNQRVNANRLELGLMWTGVVTLVGYLTWCVATFGA